MSKRPAVLHCTYWHLVFLTRVPGLRRLNWSRAIHFRDIVSAKVREAQPSYTSYIRRYHSQQSVGHQVYGTISASCERTALARHDASHAPSLRSPIRAASSRPSGYGETAGVPPPGHHPGHRHRPRHPSQGRRSHTAARSVSRASHPAAALPSISVALTEAGSLIRNHLCFASASPPFRAVTDLGLLCCRAVIMDMDDTAAAAAVGVAGERQAGAAAADRASLSSPVTETLTFTTTTDASRVSQCPPTRVSMGTACDALGDEGQGRVEGCKSVTGLVMACALACVVQVLDLLKVLVSLHNDKVGSRFGSHSHVRGHPLMATSHQLWTSHLPHHRYSRLTRPPVVVVTWSVGVFRAVPMRWRSTTSSADGSRQEGH